MTRTNTPIDDLANSYLDSSYELSPLEASADGQHTGAIDDFSPAGITAVADLDRATLAKLSALEPVDDVDEVTKSALTERLTTSLALHEVGETIGTLNPIASPLQAIRDSFDLMDRATDADLIAERVAAVPTALAQYEEALAYRVENGPAFPQRQVAELIKQAESMATPTGIFDDLAADLDVDGTDAKQALAGLVTTLKGLPTTDVDGVGRDRYLPNLAYFLGQNVDVDETFEWGQDQLAEIVAEQEQTAARLYGAGTSVREAIDRLNADPDRQLTSTDALKEWMQATADEAIAGLGDHFDMTERMKTIEAMVLTPGTGGIYYTGPSDDFSRPGRMWWSVPEGVTEFSTWLEKTTVYHEGVPGHHLQVAYAMEQADTLNNWRRKGVWVSGYGEGWALYSERLMADLGYLDDPGDYMGMLDSQRLRAARVVLDIGVHVRGWSTESAWEFLKENVAMDESFLAFEFLRYLGWPGQAPSYKIGQRLWESERDTALASGMTIKDFHRRALGLGCVPLEALHAALSR